MIDEEVDKRQFVVVVMRATEDPGRWNRYTRGGLVVGVADGRDERGLFERGGSVK